MGEETGAAPSPAAAGDLAALAGGIPGAPEYPPVPRASSSETRTFAAPPRDVPVEASPGAPAGASTDDVEEVAADSLGTIPDFSANSEAGSVDAVDAASTQESVPAPVDVPTEPAEPSEDEPSAPHEVVGAPVAAAVPVEMKNVAPRKGRGKLVVLLLLLVLIGGPAGAVFLAPVETVRGWLQKSGIPADIQKKILDLRGAPAQPAPAPAPGK
ncbi:MAG: hypothetical protein HUU15_15670 [Candidatus Brocadiae bacterium]|nr:hypothetical protein [Candidatus Brocadiia bacterium]